MKKTQTKHTLTSAFNQSELVFWSFRYFLGRRSYAVSDFANRLSITFHLLDSKTQKLIKIELDKAFEEDDEARALKMDYRILGDDCDREAWLKVKRAYEKAN